MATYGYGWDVTDVHGFTSSLVEVIGGVPTIAITSNITNLRFKHVQTYDMPFWIYFNGVLSARTGQ